MQVNIFGKERFKVPEVAEEAEGISLDTTCKDCGSNKIDAKGYCKKCGGFAAPEAPQITLS